jgi:hypothetical protein
MTQSEQRAQSLIYSAVGNALTIPPQLITVCRRPKTSEPPGDGWFPTLSPTRKIVSFQIIWCLFSTLLA